MQINLPEVVAEVTAAFERYEQALVGNDVSTLDALFWQSPHTVRYGATENLYGIAEIQAFRKARPSLGLQRALHRTTIVTYGLDAACTHIEFSREGQTRVGRQTQTWMRMPEGWRVVSAHVSWMG